MPCQIWVDRQFQMAINYNMKKATKDRQTNAFVILLPSL